MSSGPIHYIIDDSKQYKVRKYGMLFHIKRGAFYRFWKKKKKVGKICGLDYIKEEITSQHFEVSVHLWAGQKRR